MSATAEKRLRRVKRRDPGIDRQGWNPMMARVLGVDVRVAEGEGEKDDNKGDEEILRSYES